MHLGSWSQWMLKVKGVEYIEFVGIMLRHVEPSLQWCFFWIGVPGGKLISMEDDGSLHSALRIFEKWRKLMTIITISPHHHITTSPHPHITSLPHHYMTSLHHYITTSPHHINTVNLWFARQWLEIAVELLRHGDAGEDGIARNPMFSRTKWLPTSMWGTLSVRPVRSSLVWRSSGRHCQLYAELIICVSARNNNVIRKAVICCNRSGGCHRVQRGGAAHWNTQINTKTKGCHETDEMTKHRGPEESMKNRKSRENPFYGEYDPEESREVKKVVKWSERGHEKSREVKRQGKIKIVRKWT